MKQMLIAAALLLSLNGCIALAAGAIGAAGYACYEKRCLAHHSDSPG